MATQVTLNSGAVSSAGTLKLQTNGTTDAVHIDASQNVGIGTSSPASALDVRTSTGATIIAGRTSNVGATSTPGAFTIYAPNASGTSKIWSGIRSVVGNATAGAESASLIFSNQVAGTYTDVATLDTSGNLGLGVTPSAWASAFPAFQIGYTGALSGRNGTTEAVVLSSNYYNNSGAKYIGTGYSTRYEQYSGGHYWSTAPSGTAGTAISFTQAMTLDASGRLGIGISSPSYKLDVSGTSQQIIGRFTETDATLSSRIYAVCGTATGGIQQYGQSHATKANQFTVFSPGKLVFQTSGIEQATIDTSGNLGLGVTPSAWGNTLKAVQIGGFAAIAGSSATTNIYANSYFDGTNNIYGTSSYALSYQQNVGSGQHRWLIAAAGTAGTTATFTQAMTLDANGNLGIGATSPADKLEVWGNLRVSSSTGVHTARVGTDGTNAFFENYANGAIIFRTNVYTERMRIDSSGNVLVTGAGGLGYGTGSGGAVTQTTSRTTGVTLNKTNGAITLVSAAGSTSWQSFTVTNSTVAATDVVHVSQKSGTDLYEIHVTAVAAGSFRISFKTTAGTTTEQPVFNFAVIKAVTA